MKKIKIVLGIVAVLLVLCVIALAVYWATNKLQNELNEKTTSEQELPTMQILETEDVTVSTTPTSRPIIDLEEGNELYLDVTVIEALTNMEAEGEEELVNAILDGEIMLINYFVKAGYEKKAICQIQRFYYDFYDQLQELEIEDVIEKVSFCIPAEGATLDGFANTVQSLFGWGGEWDFDYVIGLEESL